MKQIGIMDVAGWMAERNGTEIATITQRTPVKMNKTGNPFYGKVEKIATVGILCGADYEKAVNKRLEQAGLSGDFQREQRSNHLTTVDGTSGKILLNKEGEYLLNYMVNDRVAPQITYLVDGQQADGMTLKAIEPWLPKAKESAKQAEAGLEVIEQVKVRTVKVKNIIALNMRGETVVIAP